MWITIFLRKKTPEKFLLLLPQFVPGGKYQGGKWSVATSSGECARQKVANIWKSAEYLRRTRQKSNHNRPVGWEMKTTQLNDAIICIHLDGYWHQVAKNIQFFSISSCNYCGSLQCNGSFEEMAVGIIIDNLGMQIMFCKTSGWILFRRYLYNKNMLRICRWI